jgi:hypothetical protein
MELLRVQGPKNNILAVGDYLRADGPFEIEIRNDNFDPVLSFKERYGVQLDVEAVSNVDCTSSSCDNGRVEER